MKESISSCPRLAGRDESQQGSGRAQLAGISPPPVSRRWERFPSVPNARKNAKAFLSSSERGFHRTECEHGIDAVEGAKAEAALVFAKQDWSPAEVTEQHRSHLSGSCADWEQAQ